MTANRGYYGPFRLFIYVCWEADRFYVDGFYFLCSFFVENIFSTKWFNEFIMMFWWSSKRSLTDKMKGSFFQAAVVSILLYECTTWTLTKRIEKKLDGNYTRMLRAILNKSWRQHPTKHHLYGHLPPITKSIKIERIRHAGHCWRSWNELINDVLLWTPSHGRAKARRPARSSVRIRDVDMRTDQKRWTIGRSGERGSGTPVLVARQDDDDWCSRWLLLCLCQLVMWSCLLSFKIPWEVHPVF